MNIDETALVRIIHTNVAWPCVVTVTHSNQQLQYLMNKNGDQ